MQNVVCIICVFGGGGGGGGGNVQSQWCENGRACN